MVNVTDRDKRKVNSSAIVRLLPIILFTAVVVLIVHVHEFTMPFTQFPYLKSTDETVQYDFFSYYKAWGIGISAISAVLLMIYYFVISRSRIIRKSLLYIPVIGYLLFIVISCIFSEYRDFAMFGTLDRFEGTLVHISYLVMLVYIYNCIDSVAEADIVINCVLISTAVTNLIGLTQAVGADFFGTKLGSCIIAGALRNRIVIDYPDGYTYQTVANPDYVGFYLCIIFTILLVRIINKIEEINSDAAKRTAKNYAISAGYIMLFITAVVNVASARAMGPVVGIVVGVLTVGAGYLFIYKKIRIKSVGMIFGAVIVIGVIVMVGTLVKLDLKEADVENRPKLSIATHDNTIDMLVNDIPLSIVYDRDTDMIYATDDEGKSYDIEIIDPQGVYGFDYDGLRDVITFETFVSESEEFGMMESGMMESEIMESETTESEIMASEKEVYVILTTFQMEWPFEFDEDGVYFINPAGNLVELGEVKHAGVISDYRMLNGRGYIWDTSLALLGDYIFSGAGADTFMMIFPQNDYAVRYLNGLDIDTVTDKPHNLYIQIWVSFGLTGLIMFLILTVGTIVAAGRKCRAYAVDVVRVDSADFGADAVRVDSADFGADAVRVDSAASGIDVVRVHSGASVALGASKAEDCGDDMRGRRYNLMLCIGMIAGLIGFLITGMVNDSTVSTMPLFYGTLGMLSAIARDLQAKQMQR